MKTIQEMVADLEKVQADMTDLADKLQAESDGAKAADIRKNIDAKRAAFAQVREELDLARDLQRTQAYVAQAKAEAAPDMAGKNLNPANPPASQGQADVVSDKDSDARAKTGFFLTYCAKGMNALAGRAAEAILAGPRFSGVDASGLLVQVPAQISNRLINTVGAKTMLSTDSTGYSTDSGSANLRPLTQWMPELIREPVYESMILDRVRRIPAGNGKISYPKLDSTAGPYGGVQFTWKATEGLDKGETEPAFALWESTTTELSGWTAVSEANLRRSQIDLEGLLTEIFRGACRYEWSSKIVHGTGTNQPMGILADTSVNGVTRQSAGTVEYKDLVSLAYAVKKGLRTGAMFYVEDSAEHELQDQVDSLGRPLFTPTVADGIRDRLIGYPYDVHNFVDMSGAGVNEALVDVGELGDVFFGNPIFYGFGVEQDMAIARSEHAEFKKGLIVFRLICFVGGKPLIPAAFSRLKAESA